MKHDLAELLVEMMDDGEHSVEIYEDYSGRGMYGKSTTGVVLHKGTTIGDVLAACISDSDMFEDVGYVKTIRVDALGLDTVLY